MKIGTNKYSNTINTTVQYVLLGMVCALPLNLFVNNLLLTIFLILFGLQTLYFFIKQNNKPPRIKIPLVIALNIPVILLLFGMTYSPEYSQGFKELGRLFPIVLMSIYVLVRPDFFITLKQKFLTALIIGCLFAAFLSWGLTLVELIQNGETLYGFFSRNHASHDLAEQLGVHTPYAALFVNFALGAVVYNYKNSNNKGGRIAYIICFILLSVFLFHLLARNAIFSYILFGIVYLISIRKYAFLATFGIIVIGLVYYMQTTESNFLRDRFIKSVNVFENETIFSKKDNRFDRLTTNFEVFKKFPIIGPGTANEDQYRKEEYFKNRDSEAYNDNYNAHNQFMEYLSTYGMVGGIAFLYLFFWVYKGAIQKRDVLALFCISAFFIANFSESMLERSWGIVCFVIILMLSANTFQLKEKEHSINSEKYV